MAGIIFKYIYLESCSIGANIHNYLLSLCVIPYETITETKRLQKYEEACSLVWRNLGLCVHAEQFLLWDLNGFPHITHLLYKIKERSKS